MLQDQVILLLLLCLVGLIIPWNDILVRGSEFLQGLRNSAQNQPGWMALGYVACFILLTGISVPGPTSLLMAVLGGWLFGWWALPLSSFSSSTGASLAFLSSRYWMKDSTLFRYFPQLQRFNESRTHVTWVVLLSLRLNPLVPFFMENLYFGRTLIPLWQFWLITCLGMLPLTMLYVMTGAELARVENYRDLVSWRVVACLVAISLLPLITYSVVNWRSRHSNANARSSKAE